MELSSVKTRPIIGAYYYTGWHPLRERSTVLGPCWTEWELVLGAVPRFQGHRQPRLPLLGPYDDRKPWVHTLQQALARFFGIDFFCFGIFWSGGQRYFEVPLDEAFIEHGGGAGFPFCVMWANRLPRKVLPVKIRPREVIEESRRVLTDAHDFLHLVRFVERRYFRQENYVRLFGAPIFFIFDSTFFIRQLGVVGAKETLMMARKYLSSTPSGDAYVVAVNPVPELRLEGMEGLEIYREVGFDALTHYVLLPHWKGEYIQDYGELMEERVVQWHGFKEASGLDYYPSVATGWDATPRGAIFRSMRPKRYPWWPIVVGDTPERFGYFLEKAGEYSQSHCPLPIVMVASWNEWSEGHYLEPCVDWGFGRLKAVRAIKRGVKNNG